MKQTGVNVQKFVPGLQIMDARLDEYFGIVHPQVTFDIDSIKKFINSQFVLKTRREMMPEWQQKQAMLKLRGRTGFQLIRPDFLILKIRIAHSFVYQPRRQRT